MSTGSGHWISTVDRLALYIRDGFACAYCGTDLRTVSARSITLDHLTPRVQGGTHEPRNLVTACLSCNSRRQDKPWESYATGGAVDRINALVLRAPCTELARRILLDRRSAEQDAAERATAGEN